MKEVIVFFIFDKWYCYNISNDTEKVLSIQKILGTYSVGDRLFSPQVAEFIKEFNNVSDTKVLPNIVDIESYSKQFIQKSKPLDSQDRWNLFKIIKEKNLIPDGFRINEENVFEYMKAIAAFLKKIFLETSAYEEDRFNEIEVAINNIIYERQRRGVGVDVLAAKKVIQSVEESVYKIKNRFQQEYRIFTPDNVSVQIDYLEKNGIEINGSIERTLKNYSDENKVCSLFYELIRNQKDLNCLLDILANRGGVSRTYPGFYGFGTITSRITLREPALQNIRKINRSIITPDIGYEFIYIDYSQFEAGILASLSGDDKLIRLYNDDIYKDMAIKILDDENKRGEAKKLFYRYMYGDRKLNSTTKKYFLKFKKLIEYKKSIEEEATKDKLIGTELGNYRIIEENVSLAISHQIQATASLIFKKAIIRVNERIPNAEFVLPMHDAALYQVDLKVVDIEEISNAIKDIFIEVFSEQCPNIIPRVDDSEFCPENILI